MSADLQNVRTLPELREWLKVRLRWYRDWQMASQEPRPLPPEFIGAITTLFPLPANVKDSAGTKKWANEHTLRFAELTIHQVHDWLQTHDVFDAPDCPPLDPFEDERIFNTTLEHLSRLLNFIGVRAGGTAEGPGTGSDPVKGEKKRRGRPRDTDTRRDTRIYDAWQTGQHSTYDELAREFNLKKPDVKLAIDRERKRRK